MKLKSSLPFCAFGLKKVCLCTNGSHLIKGALPEAVQDALLGLHCALAPKHLDNTGTEKHVNTS